MFLDFYGLREQPFGVTPNPRFLYHSAVHREALASLIYGVEADLGFAALIADPGMGKTTLLFYLLEKFRTTARTALIFQTLCTPLDLLRYLSNELDIQTNDNDPVSLNERIKDVLVQEARARRRVIVIIDEAQNLDESVLETVRLLSDFETQNSKLLHIILAGQLQLAEKLARPNMAQLLQRIAMLSRLKALTLEETRNYIDYRLGVAGYRGAPLFAPESIEKITALSGGTPRKINRICFNALSLGCALGTRSITGDIIKEVGSDLDIGDLLYRKGAITDNPNSASSPASVSTSTSEPESKEHQNTPQPISNPTSRDPAAHSATSVGTASAPVPARTAVPAIVLGEPAQPQLREAPVASVNPSVPPSAARPVMLPHAADAAHKSSLPSERGPSPAPVVVKRKPVQQSSNSRGSRALAFTLSGVAVAVLGVAGWTLWAGNVAQVRASVDAAPAKTRVSGQDVDLTVPEAPSAQQPTAAPAPVVTPNQRRLLQSKRIDKKPTTIADSSTSSMPAPPRAAPEPEDDQSASPALIRKVQPIYPVAARRSGIQGSVTVAAVIGTDGRPRNVHALTGDPVLARAATDAVSQWVYEPYSVNGRPVEVETEVVVDFALR